MKRKVRNRDLRDEFLPLPILNSIVSILTDMQNTRHPSSTKSLTTLLKPLGFVRVDAYKSLRGTTDNNWPIIPLWIHRSLKIIVKNPFHVSDFAPPEGVRAPTYTVGDYVIQPRLDLCTKKARRAGADKMQKDLDITRVDIHPDNVGWYGDKLVLHDW
jgi:hypothetical protein